MELVLVSAGFGLKIPQLEHYKRLVTDGQTTVATVVDKDTSTVCRRTTCADFTRITVEYAVDHRTYRSSMAVGEDDAPRLRPGDPVTVYYDPAEPEQVAIDELTGTGVWRSRAPLILVGTGLGLLLAGILRLSYVGFNELARSRARRRRERLA